MDLAEGFAQPKLANTPVNQLTQITSRIQTPKMSSFPLPENAITDGLNEIQKERRFTDLLHCCNRVKETFSNPLIPNPFDVCI